MSRIYNWIPDRPDHRDRLTAIKPKRLPPTVDPLGLDNPIEDQGDLGACTGNSYTSNLEIVLAKGGFKEELSRLMAYYNARALEGTIRQDAGASIRDVVKGCMKTGVASETTWPYNVSKFAFKPNATAMTEASRLLTLMKGWTYERVPSLVQLKQQLVAGLPVTFGFSVPDYFEEDGFANKSAPWFLKFPTKAAKIIGGHAVVAVGYTSVGVWVRNSWGKDWGSEAYPGHFLMENKWFTDPRRMVDDMWVTKPGA
jgi:C1A family cysteine protease